MRTTLDLPEGLLEEAQQLTGCGTKRQTVVTALEEVVKARRRQDLLDMLGKMKLNLTSEDIQEMRRDREPPSPDDPLVLILPSDGRHRCPAHKQPPKADPS